MLTNRRSLRNLIPENKKKRKSSSEERDSDDKRPLRVHAQRKFATVGSGGGSQTKNERCKASAASLSSASSSGKNSPSVGNPGFSSLKKRPKTEDFLTFLCLRGTNLLPPELDFFNKASVESSEEEEKVKKKKCDLSPSVQALKKKYTEQRIAKTRELRKTRDSGSAVGMKTRSSDLINRRQTRASKPSFKTNKIQRKKPSAATIIAKRKTKIAAKRVSRMLSCLAPRGTSNAAFLRTTRKLPLGRSLRGRDISEADESSSDEETSKTPHKKPIKRGKIPKTDDDDDPDEGEEIESRSRKRPKSSPKKVSSSNFSKRETRSDSHESSISPASLRPSRKTKEGANAFLNLMGKKLLSKSEDTEEDEEEESLMGVEKPNEDSNASSDISRKQGHKEIKEDKKKSVPKRSSILSNKKSDSDVSQVKDDLKEKQINNQEKKLNSVLISPMNNRLTPGVTALNEPLLVQARTSISENLSVPMLTNISGNISEVEKPQKIMGHSKDKKSSKDKEKKKQKSSSANLKELQDRLLEEAKKKMSDDERNLSTTLSSTKIPENIETPAPIRRISKDSSSRTSTPPRKILPKTELERTNAESPHLPVGVVGAALASSPRMTLVAAATSASTPLVQQPQNVPLTQPLVINTGNTNMPKGETPMPHITSTHPPPNPIPLIMPNNMMVQVRGPSGNVIQTGTIGIQLTSVPQIAVNTQPQMQPTGVSGNKPPQVLANPQATFMTRPSYNFAQQQPLIQQDPNLINPVQTPISNPNLISQSSIISSATNMITTPRVTSADLLPRMGATTKQLIVASDVSLNPSVTSSISDNPMRVCTDVTNINTQPLVSPGPPLLSPQQQIVQKTPRKSTPPSLLNHTLTSRPAATVMSAPLAQVTPHLPTQQVVVQQNHHQISFAPKPCANIPPGIIPYVGPPNFPNLLPGQTSAPSIISSQTTMQYVGYNSSPTPLPQQTPLPPSNPYSTLIDYNQKIPPPSIESHMQHSINSHMSTPMPLHQQYPLPITNPLDFGPLPDSIEKQPLSKSPPAQKTREYHSPHKSLPAVNELKGKTSKPSCNKIFNKGSSKVSAPNTSSFKVENETSPYAFDVNDSKPDLSFRNKSEPNKISKKTSHPIKKEKKFSSRRSSDDSTIAVQCDINKEDVDHDGNSSDSSIDAGGSIPIPAELASQLAAQAAKESPNNETTYFIPLKNNSGQSFGVAVKLGTEGPAGPKQKVIMKAKLVTQPINKTAGARVIGARSEDTSPLKVDSAGKKLQKLMPTVCSKSSRSHPKEEESEDCDSDSADAPGKNRVILRDEPASCLGQIESFERFPKLGQHAHLIEAPVYQPTEKEFEDPMKYIEHIRPDAEQFGICKIIPPKSFKPECNVDDDMRFTAYYQYIQKMMNRWGPNTKEMAAIRKYLATQNVVIKPHPVVGGVEIDLPALFHAVQSFGGLTEVIQKKKWGKIADYLRVPKGTQDRGNKLDDIYCKYLLPYDTLSEVEREELLRLVEEEFEERNRKILERLKDDYNEEEEDDEDEEEEEEELHECVVKGKSTSLSQFFRVARNHMMMVFKSTSDPEPREVEEEYWRLVTERDCHIQVQQGSIDAGGLEGFGFPTSKSSSCGRHPWNLKILSNNPKSLLRTMGPVMGVTVPTLHVGMLFTTGCWYRDPHGLPWVEYQHSGASKVWYGIPDSHSIAFYTAMKQLVPTFCKNKKIWLPSDTTMVPPNLLVKYGVSVCRLIQEPGQFIIVFPKAYTSNICSGYCVAESVYFAPKDYLNFAEQEFNDIRDSTEPMMFPLPKLYISIAVDDKSSKKTLKLVRPHLEKIRDYEYARRLQISEMGVKNTERINLRKEKGGKPSDDDDEEEEYECETCSANLYVSFICDVKEDLYYCLDHGILYLQKLKSSQRKQCKLLYTHSKEEITEIIKLVNRRIEEAPLLESSDEGDDSIEKSPIPSRIVSQRSSNPPSDQDCISGAIETIIDKKPPLSTRSKPDVAGTSKNVGSSKSVRKPHKKLPASKSSDEEEDDEDDDDEEDDEDDDDDDDDNDEEEEEEEDDDDSSLSPPQKSPSKSASRTKKVLKKPITGKNSNELTDNSPAPVAISKSRKTKREAQRKTGNLASEILDMLLSTSEDEYEEFDGDEDDSDESWK